MPAEFKKVNGRTVHVSNIIEHSAKIGNGTIIGYHCHISGVVGDGCKIRNGVSIPKGVSISNEVLIGDSVVFNCVEGIRAFSRVDIADTVVEEGVTIAAGAIINMGVTIGRFAFIGAGSVISKNVMPYSMTFGNPAKHWGWICKNGHRMNQRHNACPKCGVHND